MELYKLLQAIDGSQQITVKSREFLTLYNGRKDEITNCSLMENVTAIYTQDNKIVIETSEARR